jgi:hypothetical protein
MKKKTSNKKSEKISKEEQEKLVILAKTDSIKGEQLVILPEGIKTEIELKKFVLGDIDNPERKYELYYKGIMKLLRKFLPKGKNNRKARAFVYEEKNTLLTRGKRLNEKGIRGADSRMAYVSDVEELLNIITAWVVAKGTMVELFTIIRDLNVSKGYGSPINK